MLQKSRALKWKQNVDCEFWQLVTWLALPSIPGSDMNTLNRLIVFVIKEELT